ncbi:MAG TPA: S1-like domain-containing RNA-binding protein [Moraxellaceae bacterium]
MSASEDVIIGSTNHLTVTRLAPQGVYLDGGSEGDILLPNRFVPKDCKPGDELQVFVYFDSEDRLTATTETPLAEVGEVAYLEITDLNDAGIFLKWGLSKDLLLPWNEVPREQKAVLEVGQRVLVMLFADERDRIAASARLADFLKPQSEDFKEGQKVAIIIADRTELGFRVVINHRYWGLLHSSDIFSTVKKGEQRDAWIKALRPDHKLSVSLAAAGHAAKVDGASQAILDRLKKEGGFMAVGDKSAPELIYKVFGISKKAFKQSIGTLYKQRLIVIEEGGIRLVK